MQDQREFLFYSGEEPRLGMSQPDDPLVADIARIWSLPIGQRVCIQLKDGENLPTVTGRLEVASAPDTPFDPKVPLSLCVSGYLFSDRSISSWSVLDLP